jgi:hypothetical protein
MKYAAGKIFTRIDMAFRACRKSDASADGAQKLSRAFEHSKFIRTAPQLRQREGKQKQGCCCLSVSMTFSGLHW